MLENILRASSGTYCYKLDNGTYSELPTIKSGQAISGRRHSAARERLRGGLIGRPLAYARGSGADLARLDFA